MKLISKMPRSLNGTIKIPPSKSHTLRALIFATLAEGKSIIREPLLSPDAVSCINACRALGAKIDTTSSKKWIVCGTGGSLKEPTEPIDVGNSGITLRFISGIAANLCGCVNITGDESIKNNRKMAEVISAINCLGGYAYSKEKKGYAPLIIKGPIKGGIAEISGSDSQSVSACLLAGISCNKPVEIKVNNPGEKPFIEMNFAWFDKLGIEYKRKAYHHYIISGKQRFKGFNIKVPGDFSSAAFPLAAGIMVKNSKLKLTGLDIKDTQGDKQLLDVFTKMGAKINISENEITVLHSKLKGAEIDVNDFIDAIPILSVIGCYADGKTVLKNALVARSKESDRLSAMSNELKKMGADIEEKIDRLVIHKSHLRGAFVESNNDHRVALSLAVAGMIAKGSTIINKPECISKTYANFIEDMNKCGADLTKSD